MKKHLYFPITLIAVALLSGCSSIQKNNAALDEAHNSYNNARSNPQVTTLAPVELKKAGDSLGRADMALSKGQGETKVNHLAYIAKQQVEIAEETTRRKAAEMAVTNAAAQRSQVQLDARTAEADAAKQQVAEASANAERDQALIAQQERQLKELNAKKTARGMVITLGDVLFSTNKAELKSGGTRNVQKLADFLMQYPQYKVLVEGFTDSTGTNDYNQGLSERRARAVRMALIDMGTSSNRVTMRGYGEEFPVASNDTAAGRQQNRRVEIILSDDNGKFTPR